MEPVLSIHELIEKAESVIAKEKSFVEPNMGFAYQYAYNLLKHHLQTNQGGEKAGKS